MKLLTLRAPDGFHVGVLVGGDQVLDLVAARSILPLAALIASNMSSLLAAGAEGLALVSRIAALADLGQTRARLQECGALIPFANALLAPVVTEPNLVLAGSMNSRGHLREMGDELPAHPCAFHKVRSALSGSGADIVPPPGHADMIDWEGEFCVVIGSRCHRVGVEGAMEHVAGYTLLNDVSAREYVMPFVTAKGASPTAQAWERNVLGKNFPTFAPLGPVLATRDELPTPLTYQIETLVNGEIVQSSTEEDLVFGPAEMVSYFSQFYVLAPGDVISLGSPPGVGMARKPQVFLKAGDVVEVREPGIGSLRNRIAPPADRSGHL